MAKNTNKEPKKYDVIDGRTLFAYKGSRDTLIREWNQVNFSWDGKPLPHSTEPERIPFLDWNEMVAKIDSLDQQTKNMVKLQMKAYWKEYFKVVGELQEKMVFPMIDQITGTDKVVEKINQG